jgi:hypothetical protein
MVIGESASGSPILVSETFEIREPLLNGSLPWSVREKQRLMNTYNQLTKETAKKLFPDRTFMAIQTKASRLKITKTNYTKEEDQLLKKLKAKGYTYSEMVPFFRNRSAQALKNRSYRLRKTGFFKQSKNNMCESHVRLLGDYSG